MMSRLTNSTSDIIDGKAKQIDIIKEQQIYLKLKTLEDLEDELGCPLEVVFKALKEGIIDEENEDRDIMIVHSKQGYWFRDFAEDLPRLWVKDYGKTWWLKGDRSDEDES